MQQFVFYLVLESTVLALRLLTDDDEVDVLVAKFQARHGFDSNHVRVEIQRSSTIP